jgi:fatty acid desaturase (delta-4 desaturase)
VNAFAGRDATEAFLSYHRRTFPHSRWSEHQLASITSQKHVDVDKDYLELCELIEKVLPRNKSFAPWSYYVKIFVIITSAIGLEIYIHTTKSYVWYLTAVEGFLMALIGLNVQHDANHGAISRNSSINLALGLLQNYIGGSSLDWIHQHVVQVRE